MSKTRVILCEFDLCLFNDDLECTARNIMITPYGTCDDCLIPDIDDETMNRLKQEHLKKIRARQQTNADLQHI